MSPQDFLNEHGVPSLGKVLKKAETELDPWMVILETCHFEEHGDEEDGCNKVIAEAKAALQALALEDGLEIIGPDEVDETGMNATTAWGIRIEDQNRVREELRTKFKEKYK